MTRILLTAAALLLMSHFVFGQTIDDASLTSAEKQEQQAMEFLRETQNEINGLRLVENRISFAAELASLMWSLDEREARNLYAGVIDDFRQLMSQIDSQMNVLGPKPSGIEVYDPFSMIEPSDRQRMSRKFTVALGVRGALASSMAEHDPELALTFFYETSGSISNADLRKIMAQTDQSLEQRLIDQLTAFDPVKAAQLARRSLDKGFNAQQVDILRKLYAKDPDKAAELGSTYLGKIKSERLDSLDLAAVSSLLKYGTQVFDQSRTLSGQRPIYSDSELRDIADTLAQAVLSRTNDANIPLANYARDVERFQPARAVQIRAKAQARPANVRTATAATPAAYRGPVNTSGAGVTFSTTSSTNSAETLARMQREANERKLMDDVMKLGNTKLPAEQRERIITQARKTIMSTPGRDKKVIGLSALAAQLAKSGDKDLADEIMRDAATFVNPQPRNYQEFLLSWMLASGYAAVDTDRAFPILDDTIGRCNEVLASALRIAEFIDTNEEIVVDGELQIGGFGSGPGGSLVKSLTTALSGFDTAIQQLATADFQRTRDLTSRFERPEARVLAKMLVLRAILSNKSKPKTKAGSANN